MTSPDEFSSPRTDDGQDPELGQELAQLIALLVDSPEDVVVRHLSEHGGRRGGRHGGVGFSVQVAPDDVGKLIGRQGRTARALRSLLAARSAVEGVGRHELEIRSG